jgi:hypothetical protein
MWKDRYSTQSRKDAKGAKQDQKKPLRLDIFAPLR